MALYKTYWELLKTESEWWMVEKIRFICMCLSTMTLCIFLNSPISNILSHLPHIASKYKMSQYFGNKITFLKEYIHPQNLCHHFKLTCDSEIKAENVLSPQYRIGSKCRTAKHGHLQRKTMVYNQWVSSLSVCLISWETVMRAEVSSVGLILISVPSSW